MIVPQRSVGDETNSIRVQAPKTWLYLSRHAEALDRRGSTVYKNRPRFSIFGVGDYSFAPWKVAISGLYKRLEFYVIGGHAKPFVLDDTCCFLPCDTESEARMLARILNSDAARMFYSAFVFWDAKRPVTIDVLSRLNLYAAARELGLEDELEMATARRHSQAGGRQLELKFR